MFLFDFSLFINMRLNKQDQSKKEIAYNIGTSYKTMKYTKQYSDIPGVMSEMAKKERATVREVFEYFSYSDIRKIRAKSLQNIIFLLIFLKDILKQKYPNDDGHRLMYKLRDLNPMDIIKESNILESLNISERTFYDYMNTLQMILDYSCY